MFGLIKKIIYTVILIIFAITFLFIAIDFAKEYFKYKDLVVKVEATVIDSLNYSEDNDVDKDEIYYKTSMICEWEVNGEKYNQKFINEGTYLIGDKIVLNVLKDNPSEVKNPSFGNTFFMFTFFIFLCFVIFLMIRGKKLYKKYILKEKSNKIALYIDIEEEKIKKRKRRKRILLFDIFVAMIFFIGMTFGLIMESLNYYYDNNKENINVECQVIEAESYEVAGRKYTDIIGQWEIDGQIYKKVITGLEGDYLKGNAYNIGVQKETKKSLKIKSKAEVSSIRNYIIVDLLIIGFIAVMIISLKMEETESC